MCMGVISSFRKRQRTMQHNSLHSLRSLCLKTNFSLTVCLCKYVQLGICTVPPFYVFRYRMASQYSAKQQQQNKLLGCFEVEIASAYQEATVFLKIFCHKVCLLILQKGYFCLILVLLFLNLKAEVQVIFCICCSKFETPNKHCLYFFFHLI